MHTVQVLLWQTNGRDDLRAEQLAFRAGRAVLRAGWRVGVVTLTGETRTSPAGGTAHFGTLEGDEQFHCEFGGSSGSSGLAWAGSGVKLVVLGLGS